MKGAAAAWTVFATVAAAFSPWFAPARAQAPSSSHSTGLEQIGRGQGVRSDLSVVGQAGAIPSGDKLKVSQLARDLQERAAPSSTLKPAPAPSSLEAMLAPAPRLRRDSIDPEEIARVLDRGEATSIDAASAIASNMIAQPDVVVPEPEPEPGEGSE